MQPGLALFSMMIVAAPALAAYKCDTAEGILYTDIPCATRHTELPLPPSPPASESAAARRLAQNDKKQLAAIEKEEERLLNERREQKADREKTTASLKRRCALLGLEKKWSAEDAASASQLVSEKSERLKRHARRKAERFDAECQGK